MTDKLAALIREMKARAEFAQAKPYEQTMDEIQAIAADTIRAVEVIEDLVKALEHIRDFDRKQAVAFGMQAFSRLTIDAAEALARAEERLSR